MIYLRSRKKNNFWRYWQYLNGIASCTWSRACRLRTCRTMFYLVRLSSLLHLPSMFKRPVDLYAWKANRQIALIKLSSRRLKNALVTGMLYLVWKRPGRLTAARMAHAFTSCGGHSAHNRSLRWVAFSVRNTTSRRFALFLENA
jgi:hypothetical protein